MANALKTPFARTLNKVTVDRALDVVQLLGKSLPASVVSVNGGIVTAKFEVACAFILPHVTVPLLGCEYIRIPLKAGDRGVLRAADAYLGGVSGLGGGVADLAQRANLSTLVFEPTASTDWVAVDPNAVTLYAPNGVVMRDTASTYAVTLTPGGGLVVQTPGGSAVFSSAAVTTTGLDVIADGISLKNHTHGGVTVGSGHTGVPI